ncbi:hypothetical protein AMTRI_Chr13g125100 [Amborella trichopoda]|uniref:Uncharacterized protein n=1 Tax=Amborella trichopoda TaxID=13333 RepID=U5D5E9_AMBTC|nr:uncharacterized protein LOC110008257 [Amborella trichopoda]ERN17664.1 hypothetical protein AMTR_s00059p00189800 [Amborella trichopoda]|eukprot:XP_020530374.1 uncharacterized protein LOC110008257 [Amborella trichopoda]
MALTPFHLPIILSLILSDYVLCPVFTLRLEDGTPEEKMVMYNAIKSGPLDDSLEISPNEIVFGPCDKPAEHPTQIINCIYACVGHQIVYCCTTIGHCFRDKEMCIDNCP